MVVNFFAIACLTLSATVFHLNLHEPPTSRGESCEAETRISDHKGQWHFTLGLIVKVHRYFWNQLPTEPCCVTAVKLEELKATNYLQFNQREDPAGAGVCSTCESVETIGIGWPHRHKLSIDVLSHLRKDLK